MKDSEIIKLHFRYENNKGNEYFTKTIIQKNFNVAQYFTISWQYNTATKVTINTK